MAPDAEPTSAAPQLEDLTFETDITSAENVSLDYMARIRMDFLLGQNQTMITQTQFADAKAGAMLAFLGLIATRGPGAVMEVTSGAVSPDVIAQLLLHAAALVCCLIVLFPRYASLDARRDLYEYDRFSWTALTGRGHAPEDFSNFMRTADISQLVMSVARSNHTLAAILLSKFSWLRWAFAFGVADVLFMAVRMFLG